MMGGHQKEPGFFACRVNLEQRVRVGKPLRTAADAIDFSFLRGQARHLYGTRGNVSVNRVICLKLMFLPMLESTTTMTPYYAYPNRQEGIGAVAESAAGGSQHVVINGNQSGFDPNPPPPPPPGATKAMTNVCHGRIVIDGEILIPPSDDRVTPPGSPRFGSNLAGPLGNHIGQRADGKFVFRGGMVPDRHGFQSAMGGLGSNPFRKVDRRPARQAQG